MLRDWQRLTLGDLERFVAAEIARLGMIEDQETILSQGRDAGVAHSRGDASAPVRPSVPIVLDIFPADKTSGYFFDLTRTFCVGEIPVDAPQLVDPNETFGNMAQQYLGVAPAPSTFVEDVRRGAATR